GGLGGAAAVAAAATAAAQALAWRRKEEAKEFSGFEKISLEGEDDRIPPIADRYSKHRKVAEEAILLALHERFGGSSSDGLERQRDRRVKGWSNSEKKTEWQVVLAATELSTLTAVRAFVAPHLNRWLNSPAFKDMASELLQVLVQRVNPDLVEEGDGVVVDAILAIDTDRVSLKPIYRSALQELLRRHSEFSPRVLQSSLVAMGAGSGVTKTGGVEAPGGNNDPGDGKGGGGGGGTVGAGAASKVAAAERTKTVLACLFEALGAKRATREVGRVLCMISAGMAEGVAAAAAAASAAAAAEAAVEAAAAEAPRWARGGVAEAVAVVVPEAAAAAAEAPPALLPVLASLPEQCVDIVGLALELLETGQAAADVLAREGGTGTDRTAMFALGDASGRDLSYLSALSGPALRRWAATLAASVREMVVWRARKDCAAAREAGNRRKSAEQAEAKTAASTGARQHHHRNKRSAAEAIEAKSAAPNTAALLRRRQLAVTAAAAGG
ncbi:unnamed protein product, partial [Pylaiella littoralis]